MVNIPIYAFGTAFHIVSDDKQSGDEPKAPKAPVTSDQFKALVEAAYKMGCRHFDCAASYRTQDLIGQVFRNIIGEKDAISVARSELFFTSKLPLNMMRQDKMEESIRMTLDELQLDYLDLFLIHAPFSTKFVNNNEYFPSGQDGMLMLDTEVSLEETWIKMSQFKEEGLVKLIGLSNVNVSQLNRLNSLHHVDVVQNEFHLYNQDEIMREECKKLNVHFEGYAAMGSPFSAAKYGKQSPLEDPLVMKLARRYNKTPGQIIIYWLKGKGLSFVNRSDSMAHLEENLSAAINQSVVLSEEDIGLLDALNRNDRVFYYDHHEGITKHPEYPFEKRIGFKLH